LFAIVTSLVSGRILRRVGEEWLGPADFAASFG
jgi:hypothetical protein